MKQAKTVILNARATDIILGQNSPVITGLEQRIPIRAFGRGNELVIEGDDDREVSIAQRIITILIALIDDGIRLKKTDIVYIISALYDNPKLDISRIFKDSITVSKNGKRITARTFGQWRYLRAILDNPIVFGIGPAGTGKTYLAMALAINALINQKVKRIILTRPVVEAGEKLGFLPGDLAQKVDPYLRPLYDAIFDMMDYEHFQRFIDQGVIEIAPLAFMRGRTLHDAFIVLDEAQNTGPDQMKMFLTRLGLNSKMIITGDITQIDLPHDRQSGLVVIQDILKDIDGIGFVYLTKQDVVRHRIVQDIITAYDRLESKEKHND